MAPRRRASRPDTRSGRRGDAGQGGRQALGLLRPAPLGVQQAGPLQRAAACPAKRSIVSRSAGAQLPGADEGHREGPDHPPRDAQGDVHQAADPVPGQLGVGAEGLLAGRGCRGSAPPRRCAGRAPSSPPGRTGRRRRRPVWSSRIRPSAGPLPGVRSRQAASSVSTIRPSRPSRAATARRMISASRTTIEPGSASITACMVRAASCRARRRALRWLAASPRRLLQQELGVGVGQAPLLGQVAVGPHPAVGRPVLAPDRGADLLQGAPVGQGHLGAAPASPDVSPRRTFRSRKRAGSSVRAARAPKTTAAGRAARAVVRPAPTARRSPGWPSAPDPSAVTTSTAPAPGLPLRPHQGPPEGRRARRRRPGARGRPPAHQ